MWLIGFILELVFLVKYAVDHDTSFPGMKEYIPLPKCISSTLS
jgi:hypothetical protein